MWEDTGRGRGYPKWQKLARRAVREPLGSRVPSSGAPAPNARESINITTIDTININTGKHFKSVQRFFSHGPFFIVGPGIRFEAEELRYRAESSCKFPASEPAIVNGAEEEEDGWLTEPSEGTGEQKAVAGGRCARVQSPGPVGPGPGAPPTAGRCGDAAPAGPGAAAAAAAARPAAAPAPRAAD